MNQPWDAVLWWEVRRLWFNAVLAVVGISTLSIVELIGQLLVKPGQDFIEPAILWLGSALFAIVANIFYTIGWVSEWLWSGGDTARTEPFRRRVFWLGLAASSAVTFSPAAFMSLAWAVMRISETQSR